MARKPSKIPGALVSLPARKNSGLGMIMEIRSQKEAKLAYDTAIRFHQYRGVRGVKQWRIK